jgi:aminopeptidase N
MQVDARDGTHPVIVPIHDILQAGNSFDTITYSKGQAVIRMLEAYVGEAAFRSGVRHYMKDYAYGNTETDQLWAEVDAASDRKLTSVAHDFTLRPGVPMLTVSPAGNGISLSQERFAYDASGDAGGAWKVPALVQPSSGSDPLAIIRVENEAGHPSLLPGAPAGSVVNAGQTAYFRVRYEGKAFDALCGRFGTLTPDDQIGIINDAYSIGTAGKEPMSELLRLSERLPANAYPSVWTTLVARLTYLDQAYDGQAGQPAFRRFVTEVTSPVLRRIGLEAVPGESANAEIERTDLLGLLGRIGDPAVVGWAKGKFTAFLKEPSSISGTERITVLRIVAVNPDLGTWESLHSLEVNAPSGIEKDQYVDLVGAASDLGLAQRALDASLTGEMEPTLRPQIVSDVSRRHSLMALNFAIQHWDELKQFIEPTIWARYVPRLASNSFDDSVLGPLEAYAGSHIPVSAQQGVHTAESQVRFAAAVRAQRLPEIDRWLATRAQ